MEKKKKEKKRKGSLDISQPQSNWWSCFAKHFSKRLRLHPRSRSTRGAGAVFRGAGALPNGPLMNHKSRYVRSSWTWCVCWNASHKFLLLLQYIWSWIFPSIIMESIGTDMITKALNVRVKGLVLDKHVPCHFYWLISSEGLNICWGRNESLVGPCDPVEHDVLVEIPQINLYLYCWTFESYEFCCQLWKSIR